MSVSASVGPQSLPELKAQVEKILAVAKQQGASACEVAVSVQQGLETSVRQGEVETVEFNRDQGFSITVYHGQQKGSASTTVTGDQAVQDTVAAALAIAKHASPDEFAGLADKELMATEFPELDLYHAWDISPAEAIELALECEAAAFATDSRISNADGTSVNSDVGCTVYGNSHGLIAGHAGSRHSIGCVMIAEADGQMQRDYWYDYGRRADQLTAAATIGRIAAERTVSRLGARSVPTCDVPVLFAPELAGGLFGSLLGAIAGGNQYRN